MVGRPRRTIKVGLDLGENEKDPGEFRDAVLLAEKLGFDVAWLGDHFMPWVHSGKRSSFVWPLIGACLQATRRIKVGPFVTTPIGGRYHPALVAQASATLDNMYPGRLALGVGTGEAMNEVPFLAGWPRWKERMARLLEGIKLMRKLWASDSYFDFNGRFFRAKQIFLYTKPSTKIPILVSATGRKSSRLAGEHGDGIITLGSRNPPDKIKDVIFSGFDSGARGVGKNPARMEKVVSASFSLDKPGAFLKQPRGHFGNFANGALDEPDPRRIERMGLTVPDDTLVHSTTFCSSWSEVAELVWKLKKIGATQVVLQSGPDERLIRTYARELLPRLVE
jgi:coenzyme F420-dependent glucose-6-phosphate dehydrogenase